jgi:DNA invertase Pin-like site-specific DNA recombinase
MLGQTARPLSFRAARYVRMSTEHQQYSIENQSDVISSYAKSHGMEIVRTYADAGKSGLKLQNRSGLQQLLADVEERSADFSVILVFDVSRWGRFQDADESAYYEYLCKRAKIDVHYCAEGFNNDQSISSTLLKSLKRAMAGEYSRELSAKVFAGKCKLIEKGFRQGGHAGYGLRRLLVDQDGKSKGFLKFRERKSIFTDRVILVPGPPEEIQVVQEIFECFADGHVSPQQIATDLNRRGIGTDAGHTWTRAVVRDIVTNPKYIGANVFNRKSFRLQKSHVTNPPEMWVRRDNAFIPIVSLELFTRAQHAVAVRNHYYSNAELLDHLRRLLTLSGKLTGTLIDGAWGMPSRTIYGERFGGLLEAYKQIGYQVPDNYAFVAETPRLTILARVQIESLIGALEDTGARVQHDPASKVLTINSDFRVGFSIARCRNTKNRDARWMFRLDEPARPDIAVIARMDRANVNILDYYLFPRSYQIQHPRVDLGSRNSYLTEVFRHADLSLLIKLARRTKVPHEVTAH